MAKSLNKGDCHEPNDSRNDECIFTLRAAEGLFLDGGLMG